MNITLYETPAGSWRWRTDNETGDLDTDADLLANLIFGAGADVTVEPAVKP